MQIPLIVNFRSGGFQMQKAPTGGNRGSLAAGAGIPAFVIDGLFAYNPRSQWRLRPGTACLGTAGEAFGQDTIETFNARVRAAVIQIKEEVPCHPR